MCKAIREIARRGAHRSREQISEAVTEEMEFFRQWCSVPSARKIDPGAFWRLGRDAVAPSRTSYRKLRFLQKLRWDAAPRGASGLKPASTVAHKNSTGTCRNHRAPTGRRCGDLLRISCVVSRDMTTWYDSRHVIGRALHTIGRAT